jgi:hypothetical protein
MAVDKILNDRKKKAFFFLSTTATGLEGAEMV